MTDPMGITLTQILADVREVLDRTARIEERMLVVDDHSKKITELQASVTRLQIETATLASDNRRLWGGLAIAGSAAIAQFMSAIGVVL